MIWIQETFLYDYNGVIFFWQIAKHLVNVGSVLIFMDNNIRLKKGSRILIFFKHKVGMTFRMAEHEWIHSC